jgi:hypothetical protein
MNTSFSFTDGIRRKSVQEWSLKLDRLKGRRQRKCPNFSSLGDQREPNNIVSEIIHINKLNDGYRMDNLWKD